MTVEFSLDGRDFIALNGGPNFTFTPGFSIAVVCDTQQEVDRYWNAIQQAGGTPVACGWITDHFGVSWQITPAILTKLLGDEDPDKVKKAMGAMMTMVKLDGEVIGSAVEEG